jgi:hypothetical protein
MKNMQQFEIILKNDKIKSYNNIALIFLILNFAIFIFLLFYETYRYPALAFILALIVYLSMRWYLYKSNKAGYFIDEFVFFIPAAGWFGLHIYIIAAGCLLMGFLYKLSLQKIKFVFTREKVAKVNFPKKELLWNEFNNVILKDHILTLDFKNNKLMQAEIEKSLEINEAIFNSFAQAQLR